MKCSSSNPETDLVGSGTGVSIFQCVHQRQYLLFVRSADGRVGKPCFAGISGVEKM